MPEWLSVVILGIVEGITEFLPISSTGHLLLVQNRLPRQSDLFNIVIQSAAVLAVLPLFRQRLRLFFTDWRGPATRDYLLKLLAAFFITGLGGLLLDKAGFKLEENPLPIALALALGGLAFLAIEAWMKNRPSSANITWSIAVAVGVGQLLAAIFPGLSRSGATILLALILGLSRPVATEFCFLVGIPTMLAAGGLKIFKALHHPPPDATPENWGMVFLGCAVSALVSFLAVGWLLRYIQSHTFTLFGWYRLALGGAVLLLG